MDNTWPALPLEEWKDTYETLHLWTQIVGKIRLRQTPWINHSWHVTLHVSPRGLSTGAVPYGSGAFQIEFDFIDHVLRVQTSGGGTASMELRPQAVAEFHAALFRLLDGLGIRVEIHSAPNEVESPIPFSEDYEHAAYEGAYVQRLHRILVDSDRLFREFRARFVGKCSPVHFFWGSFDLAVTRFSGRRAPEHPGGIPALPDWITREAYSHEVSSCGFWPGGGPHPFPLYYSYAYPEPEGFSAAVVELDEAFYSPDLREFVLPYEAVRTASDPDGALLAFMESTYAAAADLGGWDRRALERSENLPPEAGSL